MADKTGVQFEGKEQYVKDVFDEIAPFYDRMNNIMSIGMVKGWHKLMMKKAGVKEGSVCLDVGCGTGEISFMLSERAGATGNVIGIDLTAGMLDVAREKMASLDLPKDVEFVVGDALNLPFDDDSFDIVTSGYMLRNVTDIQRAIDEMQRVLRPGGKVVCAELAKPKSKFIRVFYNLYVFKIVPMFGRRFDKGKAIDGRQPAYDWLTTSLEDFPHGDDMAAIFRNAGLKDVRYYVKSMGAVNIYEGSK